MEVNRRDFLKAAGAGTAGFLVLPSILGGDLKAFARSKQDSKPIIWEKTLYQFCSICASECGTFAYVRDGSIKWIEGNPADALGGQGKVCVKGASAMRHLYDPDRLKSPLKRTNPRKGKDEDPGWVKISWEEAFNTIGSRFNDTIAKYGPQSIIIFSRGNDGCFRLQNAIGTPNQVAHHDTCYSTHDIAWRAMVTGGGRVWTMDIENARYIMSFGWDMPGKSKLCQLLPFLKAKNEGAKVVVFDPRMSHTANMADEWIPIKPGTDLAVVLAMINIIISEGLYDKEYVEQYTYGFDKLAEHVRQYTAEWAAGISDVSAPVITRIAREFATTRPALLATYKWDAGGPRYANSFPLAQAELILSALVGNIERTGGFFMDRKFSATSMDKFAPVQYPEITEKRRVDGQHLYPLAEARHSGAMGHVAQGMLSGEPYPVKAGLVCNYNLLSFPNPDTMIDAINTMDFLVVVDIIPSEMCQLADIVLPEPHFLERSGYTSRTRQALWPQIILREGLGNLWDGKGWTSIVNGILDAMGKSEFKVDWAGLTKVRLEEAGTSVEHLKTVKGVWEDRKEPKGRTEFGTPSKKIELYSTVLEKAGYEPLPSWHERLTNPTSEYPYYILTTHLQWLLLGRLTNDPLLLELQPENYLHMHPDTAARIGVKENEYVFAESPTGKSLKIRAHITRAIRRDCVMTEHGFGHWSKGLSVAHNRGTNDGDLFPERRISDSEKIKSYNPAFQPYMVDVCVNVRKA